MKNVYKGLLAVILCAAAAIGSLNYAKAASPIALGGSIFPLTFISQNPINTTDAFNEMEALINAQVATQPGLTGAIVQFSNNLRANPLVTDFNGAVTAASANATATAGQVFLTGAVSRTIFPTDVTILASGAAASATSEKVLCSPSGILVATFPIAELTNNFPMNVFASNGGSQATPGPALVSGCAAGDSVFLSNVGASVTTTTQFSINMPYVVQ